jgi:hypothetical protein
MVGADPTWPDMGALLQAGRIGAPTCVDGLKDQWVAGVGFEPT